MKYIQISGPMQQLKLSNQSLIPFQQFLSIKLSFFLLSLDQFQLANRMKNHLLYILRSFLLQTSLIFSFNSNTCLLKTHLTEDYKQQVRNCIFRTKSYTLLTLLFCLSYCIDFEMQQAYASYAYSKFGMLRTLYQSPNCQLPNKKQALIQLLHGRLYKFIQWEYFHHSCEHKAHLHNLIEAFLMNPLNSLQRVFCWCQMQNSNQHQGLSIFWSKQQDFPLVH